jgi:hypothetical protein
MVLAPFFQIIRVIAAIFRAKVRRAIAFEDIEEYGVQKWLDELTAALLSGTTGYQKLCVSK